MHRKIIKSDDKVQNYISYTFLIRDKFAHTTGMVLVL